MGSDGTEECGPVRTDGGATATAEGTATPADVADQPADEAPSESDDRARSVEQFDPEEFDPIGTLVLIGLYAAILAIMWIFMYFVEFLGNGPTVVG